MIDRVALLADLKKQVTAAERDLGNQLKQPELAETKARLHAEWSRARELKRTATTETAWLDERITQVAVAWVLGTVFVRFCEDNRLIPEPYLTGPSDDRRELAQARYDAYVESDPDPTYRGWLERAFSELGAGQAGKLLFDPAHNPLYQIPLSHDGARELIEFWRERDEHGVLVHDFTDPLDDDGVSGWDTRFLGDLYQDLSEYIRKNYALLQTPEFVEEFILDRTMTPAIAEIGYEQLKLIDPTCGSGHFVLGAFKRLVKLWSQSGIDRHEWVRSALESVHGVDINPFAIAIARFRLLVAAMAAANVRTLAVATQYEWPIQLAVGDSLIKARQLELTLEGDDPDDPIARFSYATEDIHDYPKILQPGRYDVVVGNPPYITVKDKYLNSLYRNLYNSCIGTYALSVPFAQRFFELAKKGESESAASGRVGQITANSFMKREFGAELIEKFFTNNVELTEVIDTSGAYIPGHGTPTVILIGANRSRDNRNSTIRTVRTIQGEPKAPIRAEDGRVWNSIQELIDQPGSSNQWVSVDDLDRDRYFGKHPWILVDGGLEINELLNKASSRMLKSITKRIGFFGDTHADEVFNLADTRWIRAKTDPLSIKESHRGDDTRDWSFTGCDQTVFPYKFDHSILAEKELTSTFICHHWPQRTELWKRAVGSGKTYDQIGRPWWAWHQLPKDEGANPWAIAFAFVTTHNHFVLDRSGKVFNRSAPVIKLPESASEEEHLRLLGLLNSSTACFWLKMVSQGKSGSGMGRGIQPEAWMERYEFTGTNLENFPVPSKFPISLSISIDKAAQYMQRHSPEQIFRERKPLADTLRLSRQEWESTRYRMIAYQEELDWQVYSLYGLYHEDLYLDESDVPELALGERAFEITLARRIAKGEASDEWFKRHGSTPITEIPSHWPDSYKQIVQRRIDIIESNRAINMIERPEYKRRWATEGWDALQEKALRSWLLDRMESRDLWFDDLGQPQLITLARLTDRLSQDEDFVSVAALYAPRTELSKVVADLITPEHVPAVAALRYKPSGLKKRADWEYVWDLQRAEDREPDEAKKRKIREKIPVPPKYTSADFLRPSYWQARGKLDVPKERFISYGTTNVATPDLYGWAGWDHREQAFALATHITNAAPSTEEATPLLAALLELQPWLDQWHTEIDPAYGLSPAAFLSSHRRTLQGEHGLTDDDLRAWRPPAARGRRTR